MYILHNRYKENTKQRFQEFHKLKFLKFAQKSTPFSLIVSETLHFINSAKQNSIYEPNQSVDDIDIPFVLNNLSLREKARGTIR